MRWVSTDASVKGGQPSVLAIAETVAATALTIGLGLMTHSWWHLFFAASLAPLMLVRTERSCVLGWTMANSFDKKIDAGNLWKWVTLTLVACSVAAIILVVRVRAEASDSQAIDLFGVVFVCAVVAIVFVPLFTLGAADSLQVILPAFMARVAATTWSVITKPVQAVRAVPGNWWRITACTDFARSPDILPRPDLPSGVIDEIWGELDLNRLAWSEVTSAWRRLREPRTMRLGRVLVVLVPMIMFRISVKSTAAVWLPLLWALQPPKHRTVPWPAYLQLYARSDINRIVALVSVVTIALLGIKYVAFVVAHELAEGPGAWEARFGSNVGEALATVVRPGVFPLWQVASGVNAILAISVLLLVRGWIRRKDVGLEISETNMERTLTRLLFVRRLLTSYSTICACILLFHLAKRLPLPPVRSGIFPPI